MGVLLTFISSQVGSGLLFSSQVEQEEYEKKQAEENENSAEIEAPADIEALNKAEAW
jgi:hypothetical protein